MALESLFGPHIDRLQSSLGRTSHRQGLLMQNLANANVPGYKRQDADFHAELESKMTGRSGRSGRDTGSIRIDGSSVDMEHEVVSIAETEARYEALTELTSRAFSSLKSAIREGR